MSDVPPTTAWHALPAAECLRALESAPDGLSRAEAERRRARTGSNVFRRTPPEAAWRILARQCTGVFVWLLLAGAVIAGAVGDVLDAAAVLSVLLLNVLLGFVTELRARRAMEALLGLEVERAHVRRDGRLRDLPAADLVPGDVIELSEGQRVPADARLLHAAELRTAEAPLTGESEPVAKREADVLPAGTVVAERVNMVYKATAVVAGSATAVIVATGMATEVGRIGALTAAVEERHTPLERRLESLGRRLAAVALGVAVLVASLWLLQGLPLAVVAETAIALAVAAVPEGLPVVATIAMAMGVWRMARRRALVRHLPAVEALGSVTVICSDKTGTLTAGAMTVTSLWLPDRAIEVTGSGYAPTGAFRSSGALIDPSADPALGAALRTALLASRADIVEQGGAWRAVGDPTEAALVAAARKAGLAREALQAETPLAGEVPFRSDRMLMASFHRDGGHLVAHVKGAPQRVLERCAQEAGPTGPVPLSDERRARILARNDAMAADGLRVLALASGAVPDADEPALRSLVFVGLVGMMDPPAEGVADTVARFQVAGIRTLMITGDQRLTALAVARRLGLLTAGAEAIEGSEVDLLDDETLARRLAGVAVVSRTSPEAKLRIARALQRRGDIVAMLGDGINDAAALRQADIGVAMGLRGADLAKEAAAVILQDDRFTTIAAAIEQGRVVFDNIRHFVFYLFSCNLAEVLLFLGAGLAGIGSPLLPLQILWLNLVTDTFPALALAVEPAEPEVMRRPPRDPRAGLLPPALMGRTLRFAVAIAGVTLVALLWARGAGAPATSVAFNTLAFAQLLHLGSARSREPVVAWRRVIANPWALGAVGLVSVLQVAATEWSPLARVLHLQPLGVAGWVVALLLAAAVGVGGQAGAWMRQRAQKGRRGQKGQGG